MKHDLKESTCRGEGLCTAWEMSLEKHFIFGGQSLWLPCPSGASDCCFLALVDTISKHPLSTQLFLVPDFYGCFEINSVNIWIIPSASSIHMFDFVNSQGWNHDYPETWKVPLLHKLGLEIKLPPIGVISYQAFQRVARGVLNLETIPTLVFPTSTWIFLWHAGLN